MPRKDLEARRQYNKDYYARKGESMRSQQKARRRSDPEMKRVERARKLVVQYGITLEEYQRMHAEQHGRCAICGEPEAEGKQLAVDHDHVTGRVRGLLCQQCNMALGKFRDNIVVIRSAARYLLRAALV